MSFYCIVFYSFLVQGPISSLMTATYLWPKHVAVITRMIKEL